MVAHSIIRTSCTLIVHSSTSPYLPARSLTSYLTQLGPIYPWLGSIYPWLGPIPTKLCMYYCMRSQYKCLMLPTITTIKLQFARVMNALWMSIRYSLKSLLLLLTLLFFFFYPDQSLFSWFPKVKSIIHLPWKISESIKLMDWRVFIIITVCKSESVNKFKRWNIDPCRVNHLEFVQRLRNPSTWLKAE